MALFFDYPQANARSLLSAGQGVPRSRRLAQTRMLLPDHICVRLVGGWLVALTVLLAIVLMVRWFA